MGSMQHVYVTVHGEYTDSAWSTERAQFGVRLAFAPTASAPAKGETFTPVTNGDVVPEFGTASGTHGTLTKTWKCRINSVGSTENFDAAAQIDAAEDVWTFLNATKANVWGGFRWTHVKFAAIDATGHTVGTGSTYTFTTPVVGTGSNGTPAQLALAITLRANIVGRRGRGRVYMPAVSQATIATNGIISTTQADLWRTSMKTLIDNLQNVPGYSLNIPIVSVMSAGSATAVRPVEVRTGNRLDTIKSRRAQVDESYTTLAL